MDAWNYYRVRNDRHDAIRRWAELEGKSPTMSADLLLRHRVPCGGRRNAWEIIGALAKLIVCALDVWRVLDTR
jgi:hypothetical protein